ncbi:MAG TPA: response regulator transcription factor [Polyangiaceae bacterium]|nr:MAG: Transcriptional regulatory protein WalR [Deltaproteobacteria bacterium ADurb.Bin207]HNS99394.1 response regulator transcription factor [Polyangiaceae bacterium]HNZ23522.1 response regulator transcription factor [Polyangiaceae bacterium]HOD24753.1 response regulator transcription factor [Polyangiaceae bacterium]HOE49558.1 response regulator transcription factor [Polyangiaceae bacterium]
MKQRLLLVEDEENLAKGLELNFSLEGFSVQWVANGVDARTSWKKEMPDLVVLDLGLPDTDGLELLQEIKRVDLRVPVLVLTARASDEERITGLSLGADDYVTKPFNLTELVLRVRGLAQRSQWYRTSLPKEICLGAAVLTPSDATLRRDGETYWLTELELRLLLHLWRQRGSYVSREELLVQVWGYSAETATRTVDIFVSRLRRMLGDAANPVLLLTKRGKGYMLVREGE